MRSGVTPLPSFERLPVNEVVLSVAFERLVAFSAAHLGSFWYDLTP
jgi:hypothetical protein